MIKLIYTITLVLVIASCQQEDIELVEGTTERFKIASNHVNDSFQVYVYLPSGYPHDNAEYPLIIGLDGDSEFDNMAGIISQQIRSGSIPSAIFVGIGYGSEEANEEKRNRDYTPSKTQGVEDFETGGAGTFYEFIRSELIPELENRYQIDSSDSKTLMGHSYGGLFTLFAMFQERASNPFDKFIPVASSFWYDSGVIFEYEEAYAHLNSDLPALVYTTMGSLEGVVMVASFDEMNERILSRSYLNLTFKSEVLKGFGHSRSDYTSFEKGLEYVFNH